MKMDKIVIISIGIAVGLVFGLVLPKLLSGPAVEVAPPPPMGQAPPQVDYSETINRLKALLQQDPQNYRAWVELGNAYFDSQQPPLAVEAYSKALAIDGSSPDVITDLGIMYRALGRPQDAAAEFHKAIKLDPRHLNSRFNLGVVLFYDLKDYPGAITAWEEFLTMEPPGERAEKIKNQVRAAKEMSAGGSAGKGASLPPPPPPLSPPKEGAAR